MTTSDSQKSIRYKFIYKKDEFNQNIRIINEVNNDEYNIKTITMISCLNS